MTRLPPAAREQAPGWLVFGHWLLLLTCVACLTAAADLGLQAWQRLDRGVSPLEALGLPSAGRATPPAASASMAAPPSSALPVPTVAGPGTTPAGSTDDGRADDLAARGASDLPSSPFIAQGVVASGLDRLQPAAGATTPSSLRDDGYDPAVLDRLAAELKRRRDEVEARSRALDAKAAAMALVEERLTIQVARLEGMRKDLAGVLDQVGKDEEARLAQLVKVYEAMKAKQAAPIFDAMDIELLLRIVRRMRDAKVAAVVAEMNADKARLLTTRLAEPPALPVIQ